MMNLNTISLTLRNHRWIFISGLLSLVLLTLIVFQFWPKTGDDSIETIDPISFPEQLTTTNSVNSQNVSLPQDHNQQLPVYKKVITQSLTSKASQIAQKLNLTNPRDLSGDVNFGDGIEYKNADTRLGVYKNFLSYQKNQVTTTNIGPDPQQLKTSAVNFISSLGLPVNFTNSLDFTYKTQVDEFQVPTENPAEATQIVLTLKYDLSGLEVLSPQQQTTATFDMSGNLIRLNYYSFEALELPGAFKIIAPKEALKNIRSAKLVSITTENFNPTPPDLNNVDLSSASLVYFVGGNDIIQPVWAFSGTADDIANVKYAVPAIPQKAN